MKQVILRNGQAVVEEVPAPALLSGGVLVQVAFSCISPGTETATLSTSEVKMGVGLIRSALRHPEKVRQVIASVKTRGFRATKALVQGRLGFGSAVGYSCAGIVAEVDEGVESFRPGDRVACAGAGYANHAEAVVVPQNLTVAVPPAVDLAAAATATLGAIALQGVRRAQPTLGETVGVIGLGLVGQLTVQLLKAAGCRVVGIDLQRTRVELARSLGLDEGLVPTDGGLEARILALTQGFGLDAVILTAATRSDDPVNLAMRLARRKGRVVVVGDVGLDLQRAEMYHKELDLLMSTSYGPGRYDPLYEEGGIDYPFGYVRWTENRNMAAYLDLVAAGKIRLAPLIASVFPLADAAKAYETIKTEGGPLTVLLQNAVAADRRLLERRIVVTPRPRGRDGRLRVAIIGAGGFAQATHLPNLKQLADRYEIRAIVSRQGTSAVAVARQYEAAVAATDYRQVLDDPEVDAVFICTRHHLHAIQAAEALRAGKHVFVEKPMAIAREELADLVKTIQGLQAAGTCPAFMVGFNRRFSPYAVRAKEAIAAHVHPLLVRYRMNAGPLPPDHWVNGPEGGGEDRGRGLPHPRPVRLPDRRSRRRGDGDRHSVIRRGLLGRRELRGHAPVRGRLGLYAPVHRPGGAGFSQGGHGDLCRRHRRDARRLPGAGDPWREGCRDADGAAGQGAPRRTGSLPRARDRERPGAHDGGRDGRGDRVQLCDTRSGSRERCG